MNRTFYDDFFSSCAENIANEITAIDDMKQAVNLALTANSSSDFVDSVVTSQYNVILEWLGDKRGYLVDQSRNIYVQKSLINSDDTNNAKDLSTIMDDFSATKTAIAMKAQSVNESANALVGGVVTLESIVTLEELDIGEIVSQNIGNISYDEYMSMSREEQIETLTNIIQAVNYYIASGAITIPDNGRIEIPIAPGIIAYAYGSVYSTTSYGPVAVDYDPSARDACIHILGSDELNGFDGSITTSLQLQGTYTKQIDDHTSIYAREGYNIVHSSYYVEEGVNMNTNSATVSNVSVNANVTVACGVEIFVPSKWKHEEDYERPVQLYYQTNYQVYVVPTYVPVPVVPIPVPSFPSPFEIPIFGW